MSRHVTVLCACEEDAELARAALEPLGFAVDTAVGVIAMAPAEVGRVSNRDELQRLAALGTTAAGVAHEVNTTRHQGGTGLGLAVSRDIVGACGGELTAHSELGRGSRFSIYLPALP